MFVVVMIVLGVSTLVTMAVAVLTSENSIDKEYHHVANEEK